METKKKKKIQTSDKKLESKQEISDQDLELEKLARDQLLKEAKRGAVRAQTMGSQGWLKPKIPPPNKQFLQRTLASSVITKKESVKSLTKDSSKCKS
uniref:Uncharacterized protein n=1 Tax=Romanomermis culicivorax TaxID=13658 RepID=A0A915KQP1_ROMCU